MGCFMCRFEQTACAFQVQEDLQKRVSCLPAWFELYPGSTGHIFLLWLGLSLYSAAGEPVTSQTSLSEQSGATGFQVS